MEEIEEEHDFNLNISHYINIVKPEEEINLCKVHQEITNLQKEIEKATQKHNEFLKELGIPILPIV